MIKQIRPAVVRIQSSSGTGSGVIFETQGQTGYIITNHHVVEGSARVTVTVNDSTNYTGSVLGTDQIRDLAVVSICCGRFKSLPFGNAVVLEPGDEVVAIGYPLGLPGEATVTRGIVSAVRYDPAYRGDVIQTDAAINPGNSGGPMLSISGEILGINTFRYEQSQSGRPIEGLSFAISEQTVRQQIPTLRAGRPVPTPAPTRRPTATPTPGRARDFGPISGKLRHDPADSFIETKYANVSITNVAVEATFVNPYSAAFNSWDYGFMLRTRTAGPDIYVAVTSDRRWSLVVGDEPPRENVGGGTIPRFYTEAGGKNHLRIVAIEQRGWLFVNGEFVSSLDLSAVTGAGDVAIFTGSFTGNEAAGAVTQFENFRGDRLSKPLRPRRREVGKGVWNQSRGTIAEYGRGTWWWKPSSLTPKASDWDYGFIIRRSSLRAGSKLSDVTVMTPGGSTKPTTLAITNTPQWRMATYPTAGSRPYAAVETTC